MNILYDHQAFSLQRFGGVSRIFTELFYNINKSRSDSAYLSLLYSYNQHLKDKGILQHTLLGELGFPKKNGIIYLANDIKSRLDIRSRRYDIYHPTYYAPHLVPNAGKAKIVATFHDMIHEKYMDKFPELQADRKVLAQKKILAAKADHIIAVSQNTSNDLQQYLNVPASKISVIHLGSSFSSFQNETTTESGEYFLYVGNRGAYKNFDFMLGAISSLLIKENIWLVCAGGRPFNKAEHEKIAALGLTRYVRQVNVNDEKLKSLYAGAIAFVFPSLYEGFGIPVLEAFACGCPCLLSNTSSLPEVAKDAALYFDPADSGSLTHAVEVILIDNGLRASLINKGRERLRSFSWLRHTEQTMDVYHTLA
jgi:glycosyltransferase involved in cell wall biosynthesis